MGGGGVRSAPLFMLLAIKRRAREADGRGARPKPTSMFMRYMYKSSGEMGGVTLVINITTRSLLLSIACGREGP